MSRGFVLAALLLAGCSSAPQAPDNGVALPVDPPLADFAEAAKSCPDLFAQIGEHPEADARKAFDGGDAAFRRYMMSGPGGAITITSPNAQPPNPASAEACRPMSFQVIETKGADAKSCAAFDRLVRDYAARYNREVSRLCSTPVPTTSH